MVDGFSSIRLTEIRTYIGMRVINSDRWILILKAAIEDQKVVISEPVRLTRGAWPPDRILGVQPILVICRSVDFSACSDKAATLVGIAVLCVLIHLAKDASFPALLKIQIPIDGRLSLGFFRPLHVVPSIFHEFRPVEQFL